MHYLEELKEMLCKELEEIAEKGELSAGSLETVHKLTDTIKNIGKIEEMKEEEGYSEGGGWMARGMYGDGMSYDDNGNSYARGRGRNAKRDSMGRYSRDSRDDYNMNGVTSYARDGRGGNHVGGTRGSMRGGQGGYSRDDGKAYMMEQLEEMMGEVETEKEREALRRCMSVLKNV